MSKKKGSKANNKSFDKSQSNSGDVITATNGNAKKDRDHSPKIHQRDKITGSLHIAQRDDLTERQKVIIDTMLHKDTRCAMIDGYWGTSKSWLSIYCALTLLNQGRVAEIKYVVNPVEASTTTEVGLLPGGVEEKLKPYSAVLYDKLNEFLPKSEIDALEKDKRIECLPVAFMRGRSWNCTAIIVDESSNISYDELLLVVSRCGEFTRIFFVGDSQNQNSIGNKSGFRRFFEVFYGDKDSMDHGIYCFELRNREDIVRSGFLRFVMEKVGVLKYNNDQASLARDEPMFLS